MTGRESLFSALPRRDNEHEWNPCDDSEPHGSHPWLDADGDYVKTLWCPGVPPSVASPTRYSTIVADPPWEVTRPTGWGRRDKNHQQLTYPTMTVEEIAGLPVCNVAADTAFLFLWTVNKYVEDAYGVARAWGFRPVTLLTWVKKPVGMGPGGHFASTTEHILYARRGSSEAAFGRKRIHPSTWFDWPKGSHSVKPEQFQDLIEQHFPAPRLELFARRPRDGWSVWGNEVQSDMELVA